MGREAQGEMWLMPIHISWLMMHFYICTPCSEKNGQKIPMPSVDVFRS